MASRRQAATAAASPAAGAAARSSSRPQPSQPPPSQPPPADPVAATVAAAATPASGDHSSVADLWSGLCRLLRRDVLRSTSSEPTPPSPMRDGGEHRWLSASVQAPTWCDLCGGFVWGRCMTCYHCLDCKYTCHAECKPLAARTSCGTNRAERFVRDGSGSSRAGQRGGAGSSKLARGDSGSHDADETDSGYSGSGQCSLQAASVQSSASGSWDSGPAVDGGLASAMSWFTRDELCKRIQQYNQRCGFAQFMTLPNKDNVFQGYVQVCLSIARPVQMSLCNRPQSLHDALRGQNGRPASMSGPMSTTAVRLPKNAVVSLHVSSNDTVTVVIEMLLKKFKIMDNPHRFALYEQTVASDADVRLRRMDRAERPLVNYLAWRTDSYMQVPTPAQLAAPPNTDVSIKRLVLQEDNSGEVVWEAFSIPELLNFLRILEKEEKERAEEIKAKYHARKKMLESRLPKDKLQQLTVASSSSPAATSVAAARKQKKR